MEKLKRTTFKYLENELYSYKDTLKEVTRLREEIIYNSSGMDENIGGGRANTISDPTGTIATRLATHKKLIYLEEMVQTIEKVYNMLPDFYKEFVQLKYWTKPQQLTMIGISEQLHVNKNKVYQAREEVIQLLALELGYR